MHLKKKVTAILLAGGSATRFGGGLNKVYLPMDGKPVIHYSLEALDSHNEIDDIVVVIREGEEGLIGQPILKKPWKIVYGGRTRSESVFNGLMATNSELVVIQDGARPFLKSYYITDCLNALDDYDGATVGIRSKDTVKIAFENQLISRTPVRTNTWLVQTPQCFKRDVLVECHMLYSGPEATDDCMLLEKQKKDVLIISGEDTNIKITTKSDLLYAEYILQEKGAN